MTSLIMLGGFAIACLAIFAFFLSLGARWLKLPRPGYLRSLGVGITNLVLSVVVLWFVLPLVPPPVNRDGENVQAIIVLIVSLVVVYLTIRIFHGGSVARIAGAYVVSLVGIGVNFAVLYL